MSTYLLKLRKEQVVDGSVPQAAEDDRALAAAFPTSWIELLACVPDG
jgi:hypothetical protein